MAGIFINVFNETENHASSLNKGKENAHTSKFKSVGNTGFAPNKALPHAQSKPKGLSIRSKSDLNVSISSHSAANKLNPKECLKIHDKPSISKKPVSPIKIKSPRSKSLTNLTKRLSPKISSPKMQNVVDSFVFAKPATPKKPKIRCEPESLAYEFDDYKFIKDEMQSIIEEERKWMRAARKGGDYLDQTDDSVLSLEDEGFISDPEFDSFESQSPMLPLPAVRDFELPEISDCED